MTSSKGPDHVANSPLTLSILLIAVSSLSSLFLFSSSLRSRTSTRSSSFARALRSVATISLACWNSCTLRSSISPLICDSLPSACCLRSCSRASAACRSDSRRDDGNGGKGGAGEVFRPPSKEEKRDVFTVEFADCGRASSSDVLPVLAVAESEAVEVLPVTTPSCEDLSWRNSSS